jgi:hypothetical protein
MKALIHNHKVVQIADIDFPVHPSMQWAECPAGVQAGWSYSDGEFLAPTPEPMPDPRATMSCGPLQLRRALRQLGLYATITAAIAQADEETQEAWEYASEVRRLEPMVEAMRVVLGKTDAEVDAIFDLAVTL